MQLKHFISVVIFMFAFVSAGALQANEATFVNGVAQLSVKLPGGKTVFIKISTSKLKTDNPYQKAFQWGGDGAFPPKYFISSFDEQIDGQNMPISLSAYSDLGNPNTCSLDQKKDGFQITIVGGDAGVSYRAVFYFKNIGGYFLLSQRKVMSGEFPEQRWEETTYHYNTGID